ncbi:MAG TPA: putative glycoside hydrolase, partial [Rectinemataceae bacterium]|nr:putative glycoside hydrolase [Rectinemataceae bacterium]
IPAAGGWYFLTSKGVVFSPDLRGFESRSEGLPVKTLNISAESEFALSKEPIEIKALAVDPAQENRLAACTNSEIWYSETSGKTWISLGSPSQSPGFKAISFGPWQGTDQHVIWVSHSIKGVFAKDVNGKNGWMNASAGLPKVFGSNIDEVSGFALFPSGPSSWILTGGMSFLGRIVQWDSAQKSFIERYSDGRDFGSVESLASAGKNGGFAISGGTIQKFSFQQGNAKLAMSPDQEFAGNAATIASALRSGYDDSVLCLARLPDSGVPDQSAMTPVVALDQLWRLSETQRLEDAVARRQKALGRNGLYLQTGFVTDPSTRAKYFALIKSLGLNSLVVDMKDDYGRLRFSPRSALLCSMGITGDTLDIESFAQEAKKQGIYIIARIVVFKDQSLYAWNGGELAVHDGATGTPWRGIKADGQAIQEYWVDPYSPQVWQYNVEIAREVTSRGFDEVQFDYIRFPTDGENLDSARFAHQEGGMSQDSALESFLRFAREKLDAPISIDIYGANGWYRSGARTGQDVEMLSNYVDVICPMLYPSHFEQAFMAQAPAELRPYRIYKLGTLRNKAIARDKTLVRPYVQAFYLDVSYDRTYYGTRYVDDEVRGVRDGANQGMTFWNNSGRYSDVPALR